MVETITAAEARRQQVNTGFLALLATGFAAFGALKDVDFIYFSLPGFVVSVIWFQKIKFFKRLATAKFKVVEQLESSFSTQPFLLEWSFLHEDRKTSTGLTDLELFVPKAIGTACAIHILLQVMEWAQKFG